ncbi:MAG TPA: T9SS type A sorting domain-containing protein, partial [Ignavibacteriaceae bacterium]|nr:T9SS type A sorting domain-containing protein [Ignavibacteriaceae bacterium]
ARYFKGIIDDIRIFNRALTNLEILDLYNENLNQGLVAYYPFNGNANDESGNGNDGILNGPTPAEDRFGNINNSYSFDGINDYIDCGNGLSLQIMNDITITAWIKSEVQIDFAPVVISKYGGDDGGWLINFPSDTSVSFDGRDHSGNYRSSGSTQEIDYAWHFLVGQREGTLWKIYLDGVLSNSNDVGSSGSIIASNNLQIGVQSGSLARYFKGIIDDIRIFNRALTNLEILDLFNLITEVREDLFSSVKEFQLSNNYPNPFNPTTKIRYSIPDRSEVILKVYDILGKEVASLVNEEKEPGYYTVDFDGSNLASGMYIYRITAGNFIETRKMILMK